MDPSTARHHIYAHASLHNHLANKKAELIDQVVQTIEHIIEYTVEHPQFHQQLPDCFDCLSVRDLIHEDPFAAMAAISYLTSRVRSALNALSRLPDELGPRWHEYFRAEWVRHVFYVYSKAYQNYRMNSYILLAM